MATTKTNYTEFLLKIGDGTSPEQFAHPCLINGDKALEITTNFTEDVVPDCDNPANPAEVVMQADSNRVTASGTGKLHKPDAKTYADWAADGSTKNVQIEVGSAGESGAFKIVTTMKCTGFSLRASRPLTVEADVSLASTGFLASQISAL